MTDKPARPTFQPAPRPRPINDGAATEALKEATRDLGFGRTSSDLSSIEPEPQLKPDPAPTAPKPLAASPEPRPKVSKPLQSAPVAVFDDRSISIKFEVDDALSTALKFEAVRRRVTVKYLILEALAAKDFPVDLANQPQDGRRVRK